MQYYSALRRRLMTRTQEKVTRQMMTSIWLQLLDFHGARRLCLLIGGIVQTGEDEASQENSVAIVYSSQLILLTAKITIYLHRSELISKNTCWSLWQLWHLTRRVWRIVTSPAGEQRFKLMSWIFEHYVQSISWSDSITKRVNLAQEPKLAGIKL